MALIQLYCNYRRCCLFLLDFRIIYILYIIEGGLGIRDTSLCNSGESQVIKRIIKTLFYRKQVCSMWIWQIKTFFTRLTLMISILIYFQYFVYYCPLDFEWQLSNTINISVHWKCFHECSAASDWLIHWYPQLQGVTVTCAYCLTVCNKSQNLIGTS